MKCQHDNAVWLPTKRGDHEPQRVECQRTDDHKLHRGNGLEWTTEAGEMGRRIAGMP